MRQARLPPCWTWAELSARPLFLSCPFSPDVKALRTPPKGDGHGRTGDHRKPHRCAWPHGRGICDDSRYHRPRPLLHRTRHLLGDVERALLLQIVEEVVADAADRGAAGHLRARRERGRRRHRRRSGGGLQDGEPQPPQLHRALPGSGDRGGRHPARRLHHGCAPHRGDELAELRRALAPQDPPPRRGRGRGHRRLRQRLRRAHRGRRGEVRRLLQRQLPRQRVRRWPRGGRQDLLLGRLRRRHAGGLSRCQDRPRRRRRRHHGLSRIR